MWASLVLNQTKNKMTKIKALVFGKADNEQLTTTEFQVAKQKISREFAQGKITSFVNAKHQLFLDRAISVRTIVIGAVSKGLIPISEARQTEKELL